MTKEELRGLIVEKIGRVNYCEICKVYGMTMGVGYDLDVEIVTTDGEAFFINAHANRFGWAFLGHARPNNQYYEYTGHNDSYQNAVCEFWKFSPKSAVMQALRRLQKSELIEILDDIKTLSKY